MLYLFRKLKKSHYIFFLKKKLFVLFWTESSLLDYVLLLTFERLFLATIYSILIFLFINFSENCMYKMYTTYIFVFKNFKINLNYNNFIYTFFLYFIFIIYAIFYLFFIIFLIFNVYKFINNNNIFNNIRIKYNK